ncbi:ATP-dependent helicase HrpB [Sphingomonas sp. AP4-R1]|uniref:ATP-dependent helicase HrpB n=1 Tax=Sphingomonas sp. AP4-R1 TaxID=2735134 RepID=UPI0014934EDF|nr:ATP-dependent helicase HrpB [Sphingomonas sp. AP4-R1]QJU58514.1 ATP-dependent helicase HrpB [Sphingomonas sp. AP4-R1]
MAELPILSVLPDLLAALEAAPNAVLVAPPGAGKTTAVAPALLDRPWCTGRVLLLGPRRLAVRAAAERIAANAGEQVGGRIGYATRLDSKQSAQTRMLAVTQGIFVQMIQSDPELAGISAVLFDEVHERSLDGDFGLALALDAQAALRPDLRIVAMSATLDGERFSRLLEGAPVIESEGRSFPIEHVHLGRAGDRIEDDMAAAIRRALAEREGGILAFLPGVAEIRRTAERLENLPGDVALHLLSGSAEPQAQRAAIQPERDGRRKLVLSTAIAETSLTIDGVRIVIDSGLARRPRYDRAAGLTRLVTERVSRAAATQRAGRAGRQGPGTVYRLWEQAATAGFPPHDPPEMLEADLSALLLACALWGVSDPTSLRWIDPPPAPAIAEARTRLMAFGMIDTDGRPTAHGKQVAALPVGPRLGHMLVRAGELGMARTAAEVAVLLSEQGLGGNDPDLDVRLRRWRTERGQRADGARKLAERWARLSSPPAGRSGPRGGQSDRDGAGPPPPPPASGRGDEVGACVALAFPDRVSRRRSGDGADWLSAGGRGFRLDTTSSLARAEWLAVAETQGSAAGARILSAAPIEQKEIESLYADRIQTQRHMKFDKATGGIVATRERRLGAVRLSGGADPEPDPDAIRQALVVAVADHGIDLLPWSNAATALRQRAAYAGAAVDLSDAALIERIDEWLPALVTGRRKLADVPGSALFEALETLLGWDGKRALDAAAPGHFTSPLGNRHAIDYAADGGPAVELRVQELFGLARHPMVGTTPLTLRLTSPAGRPIQTTKDLPGFWAGSWAAVAKEMRGRYPRHPWPDDPAGAAPTLRTKRASGG